MRAGRVVPILALAVLLGLLVVGSGRASADVEHVDVDVKDPYIVTCSGSKVAVHARDYIYNVMISVGNRQIRVGSIPAGWGATWTTEIPLKRVSVSALWRGKAIKKEVPCSSG